MRLAASRPPEARGQVRDGVRMLVATPDGIAHARFADLPHFLSAGDLLVVNTSATLAAAVDGCREDGRPVTAHFSTPLDNATWLVELREKAPDLGRVSDAAPGDVIVLPAGACLTLLYRYPDPASNRMWATSAFVTGSDTGSDTGETSARGDVEAYLTAQGRPIRYSYVPEPWPLAAYQTVFSRDPGSAEMPSAGRPFTPGLVIDLITAGIVIAPITLHAGVGSLEAGERPLPERYSVPASTAALVRLARAEGRRVVAVGTTVTRALESSADTDGIVRASRGWTDLVLGPDRPARVVSGLVTGWHDPEASHLALLEAVAGRPLVSAAYAEAEKEGYLGHEFGDSCLLLPPIPG
jgi:S-adenosylmethionine:tRNA ribosyltransferase-isomerase